LSVDEVLVAMVDVLVLFESAAGDVELALTDDFGISGVMASFVTGGVIAVVVVVVVVVEVVVVLDVGRVESKEYNKTFYIITHKLIIYSTHKP